MFSFQVLNFFSEKLHWLFYDVKSLRKLPKLNPPPQKYMFCTLFLTSIIVNSPLVKSQVLHICVVNLRLAVLYSMYDEMFDV